MKSQSLRRRALLHAARIIGGSAALVGGAGIVVGAVVGAVVTSPIWFPGLVLTDIATTAQMKDNPNYHE